MYDMQWTLYLDDFDKNHWFFIFFDNFFSLVKRFGLVIANTYVNKMVKEHRSTDGDFYFIEKLWHWQISIEIYVIRITGRSRLFIFFCIWTDEVIHTFFHLFENLFLMLLKSVNLFSCSVFLFNFLFGFRFPFGREMHQCLNLILRFFFRSNEKKLIDKFNRLAMRTKEHIQTKTHSGCVSSVQRTCELKIFFCSSFIVTPFLFCLVFDEFIFDFWRK